MKIGIIAEGCYPYVTGGVSSWIQQIVTNMPQHEFYIYAISPSEEIQKNKYELPSNIKKVTQIPLVQYEYPRKENKIKITALEKELLKNWMRFKNINSEIYKLLNDTSKVGYTQDFLHSEIFYELVTQIYKEENRTEPFIEYFWTWKNIMSPLLQVIQTKIDDVDVLHAVSTGYGGVFAANHSYLNQIPLILSEHGIYSREREEDILQFDWIPVIFKDIWIKFYHQLSLMSYHQSNQITSLFEENAQYQIEKGAESNKITILPNGVNVEMLSNIKRHQFNKDKIELGAIIRFVSIKDIKTMIYTCDQLRYLKVPFHLTLIGPTEENNEYYEECLDLITSLQLNNQITITGEADIKDYLPKIDLLLLSSISEGQPLCILEGMAVGIPSVTTDVGSCVEIQSGTKDDNIGSSGFACNPVSPTQKAEKIKYLYDNPEFLISMGDAGKERVRNHYNVKDMLKSINDLYERAGVN
ncbi:GT4 family glycosyltransferase PelF [Mycoplasma sp. P36-A1]|uniref:GT4 family glycosyltransferase PelF n=1 Tax=Mycoplasma sp. P36-A1 TaxID=3252900 RepID=UPI003C2F3ACB